MNFKILAIEHVGIAQQSDSDKLSLFFGNTLQRRMFIKKIFYKIPFRYIFLFLYHYIFLGAFREGYIGYMWANLRCDVYRMTEYKVRELS